MILVPVKNPFHCNQKLINFVTSLFISFNFELREISTNLIRAHSRLNSKSIREYLFYSHHHKSDKTYPVKKNPFKTVLYNVFCDLFHIKYFLFIYICKLKKINFLKKFLFNWFNAIYTYHYVSNSKLIKFIIDNSKLKLYF